MIIGTIVLPLIVIFMAVLVVIHALSTKKYKPKYNKNQGSLPKGYEPDRYPRDAVYD